jgi:hypothetical protein
MQMLDIDLDTDKLFVRRCKSSLSTSLIKSKIWYEISTDER